MSNLSETNSLHWSKKVFISEILENSSTEKLTSRCLHCTTSLVLYKQKMSMLTKQNNPMALVGLTDACQNCKINKKLKFKLP